MDETCADAVVEVCRGVACVVVDDDGYRVIDDNPMGAIQLRPLTTAGGWFVAIRSGYELLLLVVRELDVVVGCDSLLLVFCSMIAKFYYSYIRWGERQWVVVNRSRSQKLFFLKRKSDRRISSSTRNGNIFTIFIQSLEFE